MAICWCTFGLLSTFHFNSQKPYNEDLCPWLPANFTSVSPRQSIKCVQFLFQQIVPNFQATFENTSFKNMTCDGLKLIFQLLTILTITTGHQPLCFSFLIHEIKPNQMIFKVPFSFQTGHFTFQQKFIFCFENQQVYKQYCFIYLFNNY